MYLGLYLQVFKIGLVIIFLIGTAPLIQASIRCPYKCKCSVTSISCVEKELNEVPDFKKIVMEPSSIDLSINDIEEIKSVNFNYKRLATLTSLKLHDNIIFYVQATAFVTLSKLQRLDLSNNLLEDFSNELVVNNKELTELNLSGNLFGTKTPEIKSDTLEVLDLSFCKIEQLSKENVNKLPKLRLLYLQSNNLKELDYNIFGNNLQFTDLAFNAWKCQCETVKLFEYLTQNNLTVISNPVQCIHSFRRYEDIYDINGPVNGNKWCEIKVPNEPVTNVITIDNTDSNKTQVITTPHSTDLFFSLFQIRMNFKIWVGFGITIGIVLILVISFIILIRKQNRYKQNIRSKNTIYTVIPNKIDDHTSSTYIKNEVIV